MGSRFEEWQRGQDHKAEAGLPTERHPPLPDVWPMDYLVEAFNRAGRGYINGMSYIPIPYAELQGMAEMEGLTKQEALIVREMSVAFVGAYHSSKDPLKRAPWQGDD